MNGHSNQEYFWKSKLKSTFGWKPGWHIDEAIVKTVEWTRVWLTGGDIPGEMDRQIKEYMGEEE